MSAMSTEQLKLGFDRIEAAQACRNLMGTYSYLHTAFRNIEYVELWADREDCVLMMPWGTYRGETGVVNCYVNQHKDRRDLSPDDIRGGMYMHLMDTAVVEVAADGKTARGVWISPGHETKVNRDTKAVEAEWAWSKYAVDFIPDENGKWKIWKLRLYPLFRTDYYVPWTETEQTVFYPHDDQESLAKPSWVWGPEEIYPADEPEPPRPYQTYSDLKPFA